MAIQVNGEIIPEYLIQEEVYRLGRDPRWQTVTDEWERAAQVRQAAEFAAVNRMLLEQTAAEDPRPIDSSVLQSEIDRLKAAGGCREAVGNGIAEIRKRSDDSVIAPAGVLFRHPDNEVHDFPGKWWAANVLALLRSTELLATSRRYQERTVSGLATMAISKSALRPNLFPTSASVDRCGSLSRKRFGKCDRRIWFWRPDTRFGAIASDSPGQ